VIESDQQKLEPGAIIELFELDGTAFGADYMRFHGHSDGLIVWNGEDYGPWAIKAEGFARTGAQPPRPRLSVGNINGSISSLCMLYEDLVGAVLIRRRTFKKYLDAVNFPGGINPDADPDQQFPAELWFVDRKTNETPEAVEFELASAMEFSNAQLPGRLIIANVCSWLAIGGYRGPNCTYSGPPVAKRDDTPTADPLLDRCGGRLTSCKLRFGEAGKLPTGAFPAAGLIRV
jgi:lambda family phage minor tail protein L